MASQLNRYKTRQRDILENYLKTIPGVHFTAAEIVEYFRAGDAPIGQATIYRQLEKMVSEGTVKKYVIDGISAACFEYVDPKAHNCNSECYHCKCVKCGKLIHLHCGEVLALRSHLAAHHQFTLDPVRTVFYGLCDQCKNAE